ncbi:hypothetical protein VTN77DRAFT_4082 [Rasamsonia byssochlamydoides]|uniref:uncharacterized protein n=1 Tax=Rasamsonia byssochlamydoides TaxID=89139 RepID=UPI003743EFEB
MKSKNDTCKIRTCAPEGNTSLLNSSKKFKKPKKKFPRSSQIFQTGESVGRATSVPALHSAGRKEACSTKFIKNFSSPSGSCQNCYSLPVDWDLPGKGRDSTRIYFTGLFSGFIFFSIKDCELEGCRCFHCDPACSGRVLE